MSTVFMGNNCLGYPTGFLSNEFGEGTGIFEHQPSVHSHNNEIYIFLLPEDILHGSIIGRSAETLNHGVGDISQIEPFSVVLK